jgi:hypothetical protein
MRRHSWASVEDIMTSGSRISGHLACICNMMSLMIVQYPRIWVVMSDEVM